MDSSVHCRQFVRIDCKGMALFYRGTQYGFLIDRDNNEMKYFGDGPRSGTGKNLFTGTKTLHQAIHFWWSINIDVKWFLNHFEHFPSQYKTDLNWISWKETDFFYRFLIFNTWAIDTPHYEYGAIGREEFCWVFKGVYMLYVAIENCAWVLPFLFQDANVESTIVVLHQDTFATAIQMTVYGDLMKVTLQTNKDCLWQRCVWETLGMLVNMESSL